MNIESYLLSEVLPIFSIMNTNTTKWQFSPTYLYLAIVKYPGFERIYIYPLGVLIYHGWSILLIKFVVYIENTIGIIPWAI